MGHLHGGNTACHFLYWLYYHPDTWWLPLSSIASSQVVLLYFSPVLRQVNVKVVNMVKKKCIDMLVCLYLANCKLS